MIFKSCDLYYHNGIDNLGVVNSYGRGDSFKCSMMVKSFTPPGPLLECAEKFHGPHLNVWTIFVTPPIARSCHSIDIHIWSRITTRFCKNEPSQILRSPLSSPKYFMRPPPLFPVSLLPSTGSIRRHRRNCLPIYLAFFQQPLAPMICNSTYMIVTSVKLMSATFLENGPDTYLKSVSWPIFSRSLHYIPCLPLW